MLNQNEICAWQEDDQAYIEDLLQQENAKKVKKLKSRPFTAFYTQKTEASQTNQQKLKSQPEPPKPFKIYSPQRLPSSSIKLKKSMSPIAIHKIQIPEPVIMNTLHKGNLFLKQKKSIQQQYSERISPLQPISQKNSVLKYQQDIHETIKLLLSRKENGPYDQEYIRKEMNCLSDIQTRIKILNAKQKVLLRRIKH